MQRCERCGGAIWVTRVVDESDPDPVEERCIACGRSPRQEELAARAAARLAAEELVTNQETGLVQPRQRRRGPSHGNVRL